MNETARNNEKAKIRWMRQQKNIENANPQRGDSQNSNKWDSYESNEWDSKNTRSGTAKNTTNENANPQRGGEYPKKRTRWAPGPWAPKSNEWDSQNSNAWIHESPWKWSIYKKGPNGPRRPWPWGQGPQNPMNETAIISNQWNRSKSNECNSKKHMEETRTNLMNENANPQWGGAYSAKTG